MKSIRTVAVIAMVALALVALAGCSRTRQVPNVIGMPYDQAVKTLENDGFKLGDTRYGFSNNATAGVVARQTPTAGSELERNGEVSLTVVQPLGSIITPDVVGRTLAEAESALSTFSLTPTVTEDYSTVVAAGVVILQAPSAGTPINAGDTVGLVISKGPAPERVKVPAINGKKQADAEAALKAVGLVPAPTNAYSDKVAKGIVSAQNPVSGASMAPGSKVSFEVSLGASTQSMTVPNVVGKSQTDAVNAITAAGLVPAAIYNIDASVPKGNVSGQSPAAGSKTAKGAVVSITVSLGPETTAVIPNVVGKSSEEASAAIVAAGFKPQGATQPDAEIPKGTVISQGPAAGVKAEIGSTVQYIVSSGTPEAKQ